jgi:hypothetical protein
MIKHKHEIYMEEILLLKKFAIDILKESSLSKTQTSNAGNDFKFLLYTTHDPKKLKD